MSHSIEEYIKVDRRIDESEEQAATWAADSLRDRWEFGRMMLSERGTTKAGAPSKQLPNGLLDKLVKATGKSQTQLQYRMQFAEQYPTEDELSHAWDTLKWESWRDVIASLPKPKPAQSKSRTSPPKPHKERKTMVELAEEGESAEEIAEAVGSSKHTVRRELEREAIEQAAKSEAVEISWASAPGTAKDKLERLEKRLQREFDQRVTEAANKETERYLEFWLSQYRQTWAELERVRKSHRGAFTRDDYNMIRSCLHPDSRLSVSDDKLAEAFRLFNEANIELIDTRREKFASPVPASLRDLKRKVPRR